MTISQADVIRYTNYDKGTGSLTWRIPPSQRTQVGDEVGYSRNGGYRVFRLLGTRGYVHRLIYFRETGEWPEQVDHIDQDRSNNTWSNLRAVNNQGNSMNRSEQSNNTSGCTGVYWHKTTGVWNAMIMYKGQQMWLGRYKEWWDAVCARKSATFAYGFTSRHGTKL